MVCRTERINLTTPCRRGRAQTGELIHLHFRIPLLIVVAVVTALLAEDVAKETRGDSGPQEEARTVDVDQREHTRA